jgi:hypothetical protein
MGNRMRSTIGSMRTRQEKSLVGPAGEHYVLFRLQEISQNLAGNPRRERPGTPRQRHEAHCAELTEARLRDSRLPPRLARPLPREVEPHHGARAVRCICRLERPTFLLHALPVRISLARSRSLASWSRVSSSSVPPGIAKANGRKRRTRRRTSLRTGQDSCPKWDGGRFYQLQLHKCATGG